MHDRYENACIHACPQDDEEATDPADLEEAAAWDPEEDDRYVVLPAEIPPPSRRARPDGEAQPPQLQVEIGEAAQDGTHRGLEESSPCYASNARRPLHGAADRRLLLGLAVLALGACRDVPPTVPGALPPCFAWKVDSTLVVIDSAAPGVQVTTKRCVIGRAR
jgi:hypothetical protein